MHSSGMRLEPLPVYTFDERPGSLAISLEEASTALWRSGGNVSHAADLLRTSSDRLRRRIAKSSRLQALQHELRERVVDRAEANLAEALSDADHRRRDWATRFALNSAFAGGRGWGGRSERDAVVESEHYVVTWGDGTVIAEFRPEAPVDGD